MLEVPPNRSYNYCMMNKKENDTVREIVKQIVSTDMMIVRYNNKRKNDTRVVWKFAGIGIVQPDGMISTYQPLIDSILKEFASSGIAGWSSKNEYEFSKVYA